MFILDYIKPLKIMPTISTLIITKNEAHDIEACIESVLWTDEIIILDCGSTDNTIDICKKYAPKVKLHQTDWPGFGKQKNRALVLATSEWILSIDADERVTPELKNEILQTLDNSSYVAYQIPFQNHFLNRKIKYCFGDDFHTRLAKKEFCKFSDNIVHEKIIINGATGKLRKKIDHFSCDNMEELINKINSYSTLGAITLHQSGKKASFARALTHACWKFIKIYFINLGFLDGWPGFILAFSNFEGTFYKYAKPLLSNNHL